MKQRHFNYKVMQNYIKEKGITIKKFCEMCKITYYQYRQVVKDDIKVFVSVLYKISLVVDIPFCEMFNTKY